MKIVLLRRPVKNAVGEILVLPVPALSDEKLLTQLRTLDPTGEVRAFLKRRKLTALKDGHRFDIPLAGGNVVRQLRLSPLSPDAFHDTSLDQWRRLGGDTFQAARRHHLFAVKIALGGVRPEALPDAIERIVQGLHLAEYSFNRYKKVRGKRSQPDSFQLKRVDLIVSVSPGAKLRRAVRLGSEAARAVSETRDLVNLPPNELTPRDLVQVAREIARTPRVRLKVFGRAALRRMRAGALLAVSQGSHQEPFLIHLAYPTTGRRKKSIALVGKGITFDSGGLSIKTGKGMEEMKMDMAGAACVFGVLRAVLSRGDTLPYDLHVIVPTAENMIGGSATRPGDVVYALNGKSIEILNTDAEGRLILADALAYAERLRPDVIIDVATLTGACIVALGNEYAGLFASTEKLRDALQRCGHRAGERLWPLPLAPEYRSSIDSLVAHIKNVAANGPGAIIGALFLQEFVPEKAAWAHLDIAGPAFQTRATDYMPPGGTGFGVLTLLELLVSGALEG